MELSQEENIKASIRFLSSSNPYEQEYGLKVLINFTSKSTPGNKLQVVVFRVITTNTFAALLQSTNEVLQMLTAWLLFHLTISDVNSALVLESGIMQHIIPLLQSDTDDVAEKALLMTTNLSLNASSSHLLNKYGVIEVLTELVEHSNPLIVSTASQPLRNLLHKDSCSEFDENQRIFCHSGGIKHIKEIISRFPPPNEEILQAVCSVLHVLSIHNEIIRRIIAAAGLLGPLVTLMSSASTSHYNQELILKILTNLSLTPETEPAFIGARCLQPLVDMLYLPDASFTTKHLTVTILANLSCNEQIREMLRYSGLSTNLVELIAGTTSTDLLEPAVIVVTNLAIDEFIRLELWNAGAQSVMAHLASLMKVPGPIRDAARVAFKNLSLPISEHVQGLLEQAIEEDETVEADDLLDTTPIIPLPGTNTSSNYFFAQAASSPKGVRTTVVPDNRNSLPGANDRKPSPNGTGRNTLAAAFANASFSSSPTSKPLMTSPSRDKHVTPPPPPSRPFEASPATSPTPSSPHYTTSPPPPLNRRSPSFTLGSSPRASPTLELNHPASPLVNSTTTQVASPTLTPTPTQPAVSQPISIPTVTPPPADKPTEPVASTPPPRPARTDHGKMSRVSAATLRRPVLTADASSPPPETPADDKKPLAVDVSAPTPTPTSPEPTGRARAMTKQTNIRRNHIAKEIFDTEQSYMRSLSVCIRMYLNPLLIDNPDATPIPPDVVRTIFLNIQRIFKLTCEFLKKFKTNIAKATYPSPVTTPVNTPPLERASTANTSSSNILAATSTTTLMSTSNIGDVSFGDLFLWLFNETKIISEYIEYINGFDTSRLLIESECLKNSKFRDYLEKCRVTPECKGLTLQSLLIMPVQRIPRHILLLTDLAKHTPPEHPDYASLMRAVERTKEVAVVINDAKGRAESNTKMTLLQSALLGTPENFSLSAPNRLLLKDGSMMMSEDKKKGGSKYSYLYLFTDILLFTRQQKTKYHFIRTLPLVELKVVDIPPNETGQHAFLLLWSTENDKQEKEFILSSSKLEEKEFWLNGMKDAIFAQKKTKHERTSRNMSGGHPLPHGHPLAQQVAK